jgi:hypothetical protein
LNAHLGVWFYLTKKLNPFFFAQLLKLFVLDNNGVERKQPYIFPDVSESKHPNNKPLTSIEITYFLQTEISAALSIALLQTHFTLFFVR